MLHWHKFTSNLILKRQSQNADPPEWITGITTAMQMIKTNNSVVVVVFSWTQMKAKEEKKTLRHLPNDYGTNVVFKLESINECERSLKLHPIKWMCFIGFVVGLNNFIKFTLEEQLRLCPFYASNRNTITIPAGRRASSPALLFRFLGSFWVKKSVEMMKRLYD